MTNTQRLSRRSVLAITGGAATVALAGCLGGDDNGGSTDPEDWEDVTVIELEGHSSQWTGIAPDAIDDVANPTLVLTAGTEYELTWYNDDGAPHNIVFLDDDGNTVEGTDTTDDDEQTLVFEASEDMVEYLCEPHANAMVGDVEVHTE